MYDIERAILLIEDFVSDTKHFESYSSDFKTQSAVERQLGIIGEAVNRFDILNSEEPLSDTRRIVGFRNRLIHAYDALDASMVWVVIKRHLPLVKSEVAARLQE